MKRSCVASSRPRIPRRKRARTTSAPPPDPTRSQAHAARTTGPDERPSLINDNGPGSSPGPLSLQTYIDLLCRERRRLDFDHSPAPSSAEFQYGCDQRIDVGLLGTVIDDRGADRKPAVQRRARWRRDTG